MAKQQDDLCGLDWTVMFEKGEAFRGTHGDDHLVGTDQADTFNIRQGGEDIVKAGAGHDAIYAGANLDLGDRVNGGFGYDRLVLDGDYSSELTLHSDMIFRIEELDLVGSHDYMLALPAGTRPTHRLLLIDGTDSHSIYIDGSMATFLIKSVGSGGDDVLIGGSGSDTLAGDFGRDMMTGGAGNDSFYFNSTSDSLPSYPDVITDFTRGSDIIDLSSVDANAHKDGLQKLHFGATPGHTRDLTVTYDTAHDVTYINVFTDSDDHPDMTISLSGDYSDLTAKDFQGVGASGLPLAHVARGAFGGTGLGVSFSSHFSYGAQSELLAHHPPIV